jgi:hypothetical protein
LEHDEHGVIRASLAAQGEISQTWKTTKPNVDSVFWGIVKKYQSSWGYLLARRQLFTDINFD